MYCISRLRGTEAIAVRTLTPVLPQLLLFDYYFGEMLVWFADTWDRGHIRIDVLRVEKDKTPNHDSVVLVQDDMMGFHICIVGY